MEEARQFMFWSNKDYGDMKQKCQGFGRTMVQVINQKYEVLPKVKIRKMFMYLDLSLKKSLILTVDIPDKCTVDVTVMGGCCLVSICC